jgi:hypothetical protein
MNTSMKVMLGAVALMMFSALGIAGCLMGTYNDCVRQENGLEAQYQANQSNYANYFNKLKETASVPQMYVADLQKVYDGVMKGRYGADGSKAVMSFISEHNPNVDSSLYRQIQQVIEAGRNSFDADQRTLLDKRRVYQDTLGQMPGGFFAHMMGYPKVDLNKYNPVINDATQQAFDTKKAGPINLTGN